MAAKKKQQLTVEEKMQQALVPQEEQPYKIPANWCWIKIESINEYKSQVLNPKNHLKEKFELYSVPSFEFNYPEILQGKEIGSNKYIVKKDDVLLCKINPRINRVWLVEQHTNLTQIASSEWIIIRNEYLNKNFLRYYFTSQYFRNRLCENVSGVGGSLTRAKPALVKLYEIPLAPLNEQQRIVNVIENLFAKLDEAKRLIQNTIDKFEQNKMTILHKAFSGELTAKWRDENNLTLDNWKKTIMQNVCEKIVCGKTPTGYISDTGEIPYLKVYNIVDNGINFEKTPQFIPKKIHKEKLKSSILKPNDVIMNIVGPPLRKIAIIPKDYPEWNMNQAIVRFRVKKDVLYKFLYYILIYPKTLDKVINKTKGVVGQANISITQSRNLEIVLPTIEEQQEIVNILDKIFAKYDKIRDLKEQLEKIELLKKSILAKAFRGELGTNDPNEKSAEVLLRKILAEK